VNHPLIATAAALLACVAFVLTLPRVLVGSPTATTPPIQLESPSEDAAGQIIGEPGSLPAARWPDGSARVGSPGREGSQFEAATDGTDRPGEGEDWNSPRGTGDVPAGPGRTPRQDEDSRESEEREFEQREEREEREFEQQEERAEREAELSAERAEREAEQREESAEREAEQREESAEREADRRKRRG